MSNKVVSSDRSVRCVNGAAGRTSCVRFEELTRITPACGNHHRRTCSAARAIESTSLTTSSNG